MTPRDRLLVALARLELARDGVESLRRVGELKLDVADALRDFEVITPALAPMVPEPFERVLERAEAAFTARVALDEEADEALDELAQITGPDAPDWRQAMRQIIAITEATHRGTERAHAALSRISGIAREAIR